MSSANGIAAGLARATVCEEREENCGAQSCGRQCARAAPMTSASSRVDVTALLAGWLAGRPTHRDTLRDPPAETACAADCRLGRLALLTRLSSARLRSKADWPARAVALAARATLAAVV